MKNPDAGSLNYQIAQLRLEIAQIELRTVKITRQRMILQVAAWAILILNLLVWGAIIL